MKSSLITTVLVSCGLLVGSATAQLTVQGGLTAQELADALVGGGPNAPTISNVTLTCHPDASGTFSGGLASGLDFDNGIILSSGCIDNVVAAGGLNTDNGITCANGFPGDADLDTLIPGFTTFDACVLEFDFECEEVQILSFQYRFSSEEYNEYVNTSFNDVFGFFVNGVNIALLPDNVTPVSINNVNCGNPVGDPTPNNCGFYINNSCQPPPGSTDPNVPFPCAPPAILSEMDGFTVTLVATTVINPGVNSIKLAIADAGDQILDSNVFIKGESFICGEIDEEPDAPCDPVEGCSQGFWKQPHHHGHWVGYHPNDIFDDVFGTPGALNGKTLHTVLWQPSGPPGGGETPQIRNLARQCVAALLNAAHPDVCWDLTHDDVINMCADALMSGSNTQMNAVKDELDELNNSGCPLSGHADLNTDGVVNGFDLLILFKNWGTSDSDADINRDGTVDGHDLMLMLNEWGPVIQ